jgi:hypothetical protein
VPQICDRLEAGFNEDEFRDILTSAGVSQERLDGLIDCLETAGIDFT